MFPIVDRERFASNKIDTCLEGRFLPGARQDLGEDRNVGGRQSMTAWAEGIHRAAIAKEHRFLILLNDELRAILNGSSTAFRNARHQRLIRLIYKIDDFQSQHRQFSLT